MMLVTCIVRNDMMVLAAQHNGRMRIPSLVRCGLAVTLAMFPGIGPAQTELIGAGGARLDPIGMGLARIRRCRNQS
jgi:hypothetical protein